MIASCVLDLPQLTPPRPAPPAPVTPKRALHTPSIPLPADIHAIAVARDDDRPRTADGEDWRVGVAVGERTPHRPLLLVVAGAGGATTSIGRVERSFVAKGCFVVRREICRARRRSRGAERCRPRRGLDVSRRLMRSTRRLMRARASSRGGECWRRIITDMAPPQGEGSSPRFVSVPSSLAEPQARRVQGRSPRMQKMITSRRPR